MVGQFILVHGKQVATCLSPSMSVISTPEFDYFQHMCKEQFPLVTSQDKCCRYIKLSYLRSQQRTYLLYLSEQGSDLLTHKKSSYICAIHNPAHIFISDSEATESVGFLAKHQTQPQSEIFLPLGSLVLIIPGVWDILFY